MVYTGQGIKQGSWLGVVSDMHPKEIIHAQELLYSLDRRWWRGLLEGLGVIFFGCDALGGQLKPQE
jgi:hypothetical protein